MNLIAHMENLIIAAMTHYRAPGLALAVIDAGGNTLYQRLFGYRDDDAKLPVTENTIFGMASLTKSFTCTAMMQLHENGLIDIDARACDYLPTLADSGIRIRHLMQHTAGFFPMKRITIPEVAEELGIYEGGRAELSHSETLAKEGQRRVIERLNGVAQRLAEPGKCMSYCNDGYGLLSEIVRLYGGEASFAGYVKKHILVPLGMERSGCEFVSPFEDSDHSSLYINSNGRHMAINSFYHNAFVLNGGGAMRSTLADMKRYLHMLMSGGGAIMSAGSFARLTEPGPVCEHGGRYGMGLVCSMLDGTPVIGHNGGLTGISNRLVWAPELGIGVLALCNKTGFPITTAAHAAIRAVGMGKDPKPTETLTSSRIDDLKEPQELILGTYRSGEGVCRRLYAGRNGELLVDMSPA